MASGDEVFSPRRLRAARERAQLTQKRAATQLGVSYQTYQFWEQGRQVPRVNQLLAAARLFGEEFEYFVEPSRSPERAGDPDDGDGVDT